MPKLRFHNSLLNGTEKKKLEKKLELKQREIEEIENLIALILEITKSVNVLLIEHNMAVVFCLAEYVTVMNSGTIMAEGTPSEIENNHEVQDLYLGN